MRRRYITLGGRFATYGEAETYGASLHDQAGNQHEYRFVPMSVAYRRITVGPDGAPLR